MNTDRSKHRMERLRQIELEQQQWEQDALVMPEVRTSLLPRRRLTHCGTGMEPAAAALVPLCQDRIQRPRRAVAPSQGLFDSFLMVALSEQRNQIHEAPTPKATCSDLGESPRPSSPHTIYTPRSEQGSFAYNNTIRASRPPPRPPLYYGVARYQSQDCSARQSPSFRTH